MSVSNFDSSPIRPANERNGDELHTAAYEFGRQSRLQFGRAASTDDTATQKMSFETAEPELAKVWNERQATRGDRHPWQAARETARDAWNQVYDALAGDSPSKTKTNG